MISVRHTGRLIETTNIKQVVIPYHRLPFNPDDCLALHRAGSRIMADDIKQVLVLDCK